MTTRWISRPMSACVVVLSALVLLAGGARAQGLGPDDFGQYLFPPELIMQHQQVIGLGAAQRKAVTEAIGKAQTKILDLQWEIQAEAQKLSELMRQPAVDETAALAQVDRVLGVERQIKREQLSLLIRIKNTLSREQQAKLQTLRSAPAPGKQ